MEIWTKSTKKEKSFFMVVAFLALYFVTTTYIAFDRLKTSPLELYDSELIEPKKISLSTENLNNELNEAIKDIDINRIKYITIMLREKEIEASVKKEAGAIILIPNLYKEGVNHSTTEELLLQYASGSSLAFAGNCPTNKYAYECSGVSYSGDGHVVAGTCHCVMK